MIEEMITKFSELYTTFMGLPLEYQILVGLGVIAGIAGLRIVWKLLFPLRWILGMLFRGIGFVFNSNKQRKKTQKDPDFDNIAWDLSSEEATQITYDYFSAPGVIENINDEHIAKLDAAVLYYGLQGNGRLTKERNRRSSKSATNIPFDVSSKDAAQLTYDHYAQPEHAKSLCDGQMELLSEAIELFGLKKNGLLTDERNRRKMAQRAEELLAPKTRGREAELEARIAQLEKELAFENDTSIDRS